MREYIHMPHGDVTVFESDLLCISQEQFQYRFPKSKKKRIRNKWAKQSKNFKFKEIHKMVVIGNNVYLSAKKIQEIKKKFESNQLQYLRV
jgi:hypothetical protein